MAKRINKKQDKPTEKGVTIRQFFYMHNYFAEMMIISQEREFKQEVKSVSEWRKIVESKNIILK